jgi:hypothetical protein
MAFPYEEFDLSGVHTYPLHSRESKVRADDFARPMPADTGIGAFLNSLPNVLAAADLKTVADAMVRARRASGIVWGLGGHVVKTGLGPVLIDLMHKGFVSAIATNGSAVIHDFEIALSGATSEDVEKALGPGRFGMADETGRVFNEAVTSGVDQGLGIGQALGVFLEQHRPRFADKSIVAMAARLKIPLTVHVALGTDITHMHPAASGRALGEGSLRDFRYFVSSIGRLAGGVYLNCGSAVVLPEVFLKAVALARNRGIALDGLTTVNLDFVRMYRPHTNVVTRPTAGIGRGFTIVGHHEIMIPLLAAAVVELDRGYAKIESSRPE